MPGPSETVHTPAVCDAALSHVFEVLGKRWNGVILGTLMNGGSGFADLRRSIGTISDSMLSDRLAELGRAGLVRRTVVEGPPVAVAYELTDAGTAMMPALEALTTWARENWERPTSDPC
ncbi:MAG: HxlR family transcriptional regulator [Nocardioidaceae bacterium]|nr:HxlR family transcriptional regulator [Nocardioidaceae bacterium]